MHVSSLVTQGFGMEEAKALADLQTIVTRVSGSRALDTIAHNAAELSLFLEKHIIPKLNTPVGRVRSRKLLTSHYSLFPHSVLSLSLSLLSPHPQKLVPSEI